MAFSFSNAASGGGGFGGGPATSGGPTVRDGPELQEMQTDKLGFTAINGTAQLRLIPTPWPSDALPPPSASLLAVASRKGLLAGAGPEGICLASTDSMRAAFREKPEEGSDKIRSFTPQMSIPYPKPGHVTFSTDENVLVASRQEQGGLDAFHLGQLANGQANPALTISTNGQGLRAVVPNPSPDVPELFALITNDGELLMADLKTGGLRGGQSGSVLKSGVTCCSWSNKGKQLVAGGADGTVTQMKPDGSVVATIPKSTSIPHGCHVSGISWLENDSFFVIYTPSGTDSGSVEPSEFYIVTREPKTTNFAFQKLPEVVGPFGLERIPPFHFIVRLRNFPPYIQDMLVLTGCCSTDIGVVTKTDKGFSIDNAATGDFALTTIGDDARRAQLPMAQDMSDTSPIGMALDLSSNEKVPNPIPSDSSVLETPGPVPDLLVLTNEGILLSWWIIYNDSVRQGTSFSGFQGVTSSSPDAGVSPPASSDPEPQRPTAPTSTFGQSSTSSAFSKPSLPTFGSTNSQSTFGGSSESAFGKASSIGKASWTSTGFGGNSASQTGGSSFGQPSFGQPSFGQSGFGSATPSSAHSAPTFGSASSMGGQSGGFGQPASAPSPAFGKPSFGASGFGGSSAASPFGSAAAKPPSSSGFASFSQGGGFGGFGGAKKDESAASPFAKTSGENVFGKPSQGNAFGAQPSSGSGFGSANAGSSKTPFGAGEFKIGSSFKGDGTAKDDLPKPQNVSGFGLGSLEDTLHDTSTPLSPTHDKEEEMGDERDEVSSEEGKQKESPFRGFQQQEQKQVPQTLVTPPSTLSQSKATPAQPVSSLFGTSNQQSTTPLAPPSNTGWSFGQLPSTTPKDTSAPLPSTTPKETPAPAQKNIFGPKSQAGQEAQDAPKIKQEPPNDDDESADLSQIPEAPLPPDPVSKPGFATGDTSVSSLNSRRTESPPDDAPLPPDFVPANKSATKQAEAEALPSDKEEGEVDEDEFSSDFEGTEEDAEEDVSPIDDPTEEHVNDLHTSPESSSKSGEKSQEASPTGDLFTKVSKTTAQKPVRPLFGEVGQTGPILPPPNPQESPRSPSPVRHLGPTNALKAEPSRSVSAPAHPRSVIDKRKAEHSQSQMAIQAAQAREEEIAKQKAIKAKEARAREQAEAEEIQRLEDNEDERLRAELQAPLQPSPKLDEFVTYQPKGADEGSKSGIPAQIERLYQDINSMIYTLGINARSLSAFMKYQQEQQPNDSWPSVLKSETPMDALNDEQVLDDVCRLHEGNAVLEEMLKDCQIQDVTPKLQDCHNMLSQDLLDLRTKLAGIRKSLTLKSTTGSALSSPLSADQASLQQDLRKSSALAQSKLVQIEEALSVLRSRVTEVAPPEQGSRRQTMFGAESRKKPTVEAVSNTISKMTAMAEKKSADIDFLEAQLRRLDMKGSHNNGNGATPNGTPDRSQAAGTPKSGKSSVYHTPDSKFGGSTRSTPRRRTTAAGAAAMISSEDKEKWQMKAQRRKEMASILVEVLAERRKAGVSKS